MKSNGVIQKGLDFVARQEKTYKVNMLRVSVQNFFLTLTQQYQSLYIVALGASPLHLGIVTGIGGIAGATVAAPTGWLADKYGIRKILLFATSLLAIGALIFALAPNWIIIIPAMFIATLAQRMVMTVCPIVCGSCLMDEERATGMQLCDTLSAIPRLVSPLLAAFLIVGFGGMGVEGIRPLYYLQSLGLCLVLALILKWFSNPKKRRTKDSTSSFLDGLRQVNAGGWTVRKWIVYLSLSTIPFSINTVYLPLFAAEIKHADQFILGAMGAVSTLVPLLLSIPTGRLADTIGRKKVVYITSPIYWLSILLLVYAPNPTVLIVSGILQGFYLLTAVTQGAMTAELVPPSLLGRWYGVLGSFRGLVMVVAPILSGIIWSTIGPAYVFFFIILTEISKLLILVTMPETLKKKS